MKVFSIPHLALALVLPVAVCASAAPKAYEASYSDLKPVLDGSIIDDAAWAKASWSEPFAQRMTGKAPKSATRFKALYTDDALYVAAECVESEMDKIADEHNAIEYWKCDVVELFAIPHKEEMIHLVYSARNNANDEIPGATAKRTRDMIGWAAKSRMLADRWTVEFCIPLNLLGVDPSSADVRMPFNLCRNAAPKKELSSWSAQVGNGNFKDANTFGAIVLKATPVPAAAAVKAAAARPHAISLLRRWQSIRADPLWKPILRALPVEAAKLDALAAKLDLSRADSAAFAETLAAVEKREADERGAKRVRIHRELFGD